MLLLCKNSTRRPEQLRLLNMLPYSFPLPEASFSMRFTAIFSRKPSADSSSSGLRIRYPVSYHNHDSVHNSATYQIPILFHLILSLLCRSRLSPGRLRRLITTIKTPTAIKMTCSTERVVSASNVLTYGSIFR